MKTRTLLLLAAATGFAILLAGVALLFQLLNREEVAPPATLGEVVEVGDMTLVVRSAAEDATRLTVVVDIGGVDDPDGAEQFRLIAAGRPAPLVDSCGATTVEAAPCTLVFDVSGADGRSRQLLYDRGDESARWDLSAP